MQGVSAFHSGLDYQNLLAQAQARAALQRFQEPLFSDVRAALMFSFHMDEREILAFPQCYAGNPTYGCRVALTAYEWHAQAALIREDIAKNFRDLELALVLADYGAGRYRVAGAQQFAEEFARRSDKPYVTKQGVLRHFGLSDKQVEVIARTAAVPKRTVERILADLRMHIGQMQDNIQPRLDLLFVATGLCERL
jgi:hypothetical protein